MDSQVQYEALLKQWGFNPESQNTANKFYEISKSVSQMLSRLWQTRPLTQAFKTKQLELPLGLSH